MSDIKGMLGCQVMFFFTSLSIDLIIMSELKFNDCDLPSHVFELF